MYVISVYECDICGNKFAVETDVNDSCGAVCCPMDGSDDISWKYDKEVGEAL